MNDAYRADLTQVIEANNRRIDGRFDQLRAEVRADLAESAGSVRKELGDGIAALRKELVDSNAVTRKDMTDGFAALRVQMAGVRADLMKWSFAFWVGAVLAIAALAGVLRWTS